MTEAEWNAEGEKRFGKDKMKWKFVCPICKFVQSVTDYRDAGAPEDCVGYSCLGRWKSGPVKDAFGSGKRKNGPCNYAGGGFFKLNPITVTFPDGASNNFFDFAEADTAPVLAAQETPK